METLYIARNGIFEIGALDLPVRPENKAEIVFINDDLEIDLAWDPGQVSRGLVSDGTVRIFGQPKTHMITMTRDALENDDFLDLDEAVVDWNIGDEIILPATHFQRVLEPPGIAESARLVIQTISDNRVYLESNLTQAHIRPRNDLKLHIVNLTRNVVLRSESPAKIRDRGHVMFRNSDVEVRHAAFEGLGRTDKSIPLDDLIVDVMEDAYNLSIPATEQVHNRRGRYSVHFHLNGTQPSASSPPSKMYGSVVVDTPGWGFVSHSSHVDFQRNVCFEFGGAGFVTEAGDELGNFFDNVAIRGKGNGEYRQKRIVFANLDRPQPLADFAFSGDGFWFQGPALRVRNNVANGCNGAGMIWFTTGAADFAQLHTAENGYQQNRYTHFPRAAVSDIYGDRPDFADFLPRYWDHSDSDEKLVVADLPILELDGFESYANFVGFRLRFNNHQSNSWYKEGRFDYDEHIVQVCEPDNRCAIRMRQTIDNLMLWNNEQGFRIRYNTRTDWNHVSVLNRLAYVDPQGVDAYIGHSGAEFNFQIHETTFTDLAIDGYPVAGWIENSNGVTRSRIQFLDPDPPAYSNYANFDTWNVNRTCNSPIVSGLLVSSTIARLSLTNQTKGTRYLIRYKASSEQLWSQVSSTNSSVVLPGLSPAIQYVFQIVAGCSVDNKETAVSEWTAEQSFTTNP